MYCIFMPLGEIEEEEPMKKKKPDTIFQKFYDKIRYATTPPWLKELLLLCEELILMILTQMGQQACLSMQKLIMKAESMDMSGIDKAKWVKDQFLKEFTTITITDSMINLALEFFVGKLKKEGFIK